MSGNVMESLDIALRKVAIFADLSDGEMAWFVSHAEDLHLNTGDVLFGAGNAADALFVMLEGEIHGQLNGSDVPVFIARAGQVTGMLPFSRMTNYQVGCRAAMPTRIARLHKDLFTEMLQRI